MAVCLLGSGFCALVYQTTWLREFRVFFGASTLATAAVVAIFMGGLGFGSVFWGKRADQSAEPLRLYAWLEMGTAVSAALTPLLLLGARELYLALGGTQALGTFCGNGLRLALSTAVMLAPTFLLGGTVPAAVRAAETDEDPARRAVGWLYGANTLGALAGTGLATFLLLGHWGNRATLWAACLLNLAVAATAFRLARRGLGGSPASSWAAEPFAAGAPVSRSDAEELLISNDCRRRAEQRRPSSWVLGVAVIAGFAFFLMEAVWYRMLSPLLGGSTFTFGAILAVALLGTAAGSLCFATLGATRQVTLTGLAWVCSLEALALALPYAWGDWLAVLAVSLQPVTKLGPLGKMVVWHLVSFLVVFPASFFAGIQFPQLIALLGRGRQQVGFQTGRVYGWNTVGAVGGALAGGFGLLPLVTAPGMWRWLILLLGLVALAVLLGDFRRRGTLVGLGPLGSVMAAAGLAGLATGPTAAWRHTPIGSGRVTVAAESLNQWRAFIHSRGEVLFWEAEGRESSIGVTKENGLALLVNGKSDGNSVLDSGTQVMLGLLPVLIHPQPKQGLVVGLGTGSSAGWMGAVRSLERVDVVELEPAVIQMAALCAPVNCDVLSNSKVHVVIGDAREVIQTTRRDYDVIASEPSNPYRAGVASLFTREFYEAVARRLRPGGLFVQWMQAYEVDGATLSGVYATLGAVFPEIESWRSSSGDLLLVASQEPMVHDLPALRARIQTEPYRSGLARVWRVTDLEGVFAHYVANGSLARAVSEARPPINTDDRNWLEFALAWTVGQEADFDLDVLTRLAREEGFHRPKVQGDALDWPLVSDRTVSASAFDGSAVILPDSDPGFSARVAAKKAYVENDLEGALAAWKSQSKPPSDLMEFTLLAESLATLGSTQALAWAERLRPWHPTEADAILGSFLCRTGREEAGAALLERCLQDWHTNAWPPSRLVLNTMQTASTLAMKSGSQSFGWRIFSSLRQPFALYLLDQERIQRTLDLARYLDGLGSSHWTAEVLASLEPHPQWRREFLQFRADYYSRMGDPRSAAARTDLARYERAASKPFLYRKQRPTTPQWTARQAPSSAAGNVHGIPTAGSDIPLPVHARSPRQEAPDAPVGGSAQTLPGRNGLADGTSPVP